MGESAALEAEKSCYEGKSDIHGRSQGPIPLLSYKGEFKHGLVHGRGTIIIESGDAVEVIARDGQIVAFSNELTHKHIRLKENECWREALVIARHPVQTDKFQIRFCDFCYNASNQGDRWVFLYLENFQVMSKYNIHVA